MPASQWAESSDDINLAPSRVATLRIMHYCLEDIAGDREIGIAVMPGIENHP
jgi:hypothetical protein